ncbi:hypothetical protein ABZP36_009259 [Zizania latifolia]
MLNSIFSGSNYLTVLELQDSAINKVPASIGNLFNLRYIGLRRTKVQKLPECSEKLSNLQTLDIKQTKIVKLPRGIARIKKLRHLIADRYADERQSDFRYFIGVEAPKGLSGSFPKLKTIVLNHMPDVNQLEIMDGALPVIEDMYIMSLTGLERIPQGIENLHSLKKLRLVNLHKDFKAHWINEKMLLKMQHVPDLHVHEA